MFGAIYGDIVGSVYEFRNLKDKKAPHFINGCHFTDDTVMTLAVADALLQCKDAANDIENFKKNLVSSMHKLGKAHLKAGYGNRFYTWLVIRCEEPYYSFGNGSAMRVSPVAWYAKTLEETKILAEASASVTHDHPEGIKGAVATACAIWLARNGTRKEDIKAYIQKYYYSIDFTLDEIRPYYRFDATCQGSVPQALEAFFESESFEDAIRNAISIGGDSDTIAAITGSVAEAYYGMTQTQKEKALSYLTDDLRDIAKRFEERIL
ncbi:MAG: ADP-ribosylglycohydrolase family protein [Clostridia bacterium]|nr:ADP-ribosylglycohydrolase family protein [Clostridia bacterium]